MKLVTVSRSDINFTPTFTHCADIEHTMKLKKSKLALGSLGKTNLSHEHNCFSIQTIRSKGLVRKLFLKLFPAPRLEPIMRDRGVRGKLPLEGQLLALAPDPLSGLGVELVHGLVAVVEATGDGEHAVHAAHGRTPLPLLGEGAHPLPLPAGRARPRGQPRGHRKEHGRDPVVVATSHGNSDLKTNEKTNILVQ